MSQHNQIDLIEFPTTSAEELSTQKAFFSEVFDWSFKEWSDAYIDTQDSGLVSGFNATDQETRPTMPLAVIYSEDLEATKDNIISAGGTICKDTYSFPGGRRFHFRDPAGNELAVWSA